MLVLEERAALDGTEREFFGIAHADEAACAAAIPVLEGRADVAPE